jgi:hypothetical protein
MVFDIELNKKTYRVNSNEFNKITHNEYTNLCIRDNLGYCERIISLMNELSKSSLIDQCIFYNTMYGGFIPIGCASTFTQITLENTPIPHIENIKYNIQEHDIHNVLIEPTSHDNIYYQFTKLICSCSYTINIECSRPSDLVCLS